MLAGFILLGLFAWPATISLTAHAIQKHVWWRRTLNLPWDDVSAVEKGNSGYIQVFGKTGQSLTFSPNHADPERFVEEVKRRAGLTAVINGSAPPGLHQG
jgi:hypothetical protein